MSDAREAVVRERVASVIKRTLLSYGWQEKSWGGLDARNIHLGPAGLDQLADRILEVLRSGGEEPEEPDDRGFRRLEFDATSDTASDRFRRPEPTVEGEEFRALTNHALAAMLPEDRLSREAARRLRERPDGERERAAGRIVLDLVNDLPITADDEDFGCELLDRLAEVGVTRPAVHEPTREGENDG